MLALIIHLHGATHRADNVAHLQALLSPAAGFATEVLSAVRGADLGAEARAALSDLQLHPAYPFALSDGEIGCFLSHRRAWQRLVESEHKACLILEDDALIDLPVLQTALAQWPDECALMQLQTRPLPLSAGVAGPVRPVPLRTTGQVITRAGAERLLSLTVTIDRPIDAFLQMVWHHGLAIQSLHPSGVSEAGGSVGQTTIQKKGRKSLWGEIKRSGQRSIYRARVKALSRRSLSSGATPSKI